MGMRNQVAVRDAVLCVNRGAARTLVDDICAKPDSSGNVSRRQGTWSDEPSERSERWAICFGYKESVDEGNFGRGIWGWGCTTNGDEVQATGSRVPPTGGNRNGTEQGVPTCESNFQFSGIWVI